MSIPILTILKNGQTVKTLQVEGEILLGRAKECTLFLDEKAISRQHALFKWVGGKLEIEKKSEFGLIQVNGAECATALLKDGDIISIGSYLIRVSLPSAQSVQAAQPVQSVQSVQPPPTPMETPAELSPALPVLPEGDGNADQSFGQSLEEQGSATGGNENLSEAFAGIEGAGPLEQEPPKLEEISSSLEAAPAEDAFQNNEDGKTQITSTTKLTVKLVFKPGTTNFEEYPLTKNEVSIGRGKDCDIILNDKKASRKNALIRRAGINFIIKDLDSVNGTYVNGEKITEHELSGDDLIRIGGVEFQFKAQSADYAGREKDFLSIPDLPDLPELDGASLSGDSAGHGVTGPVSTGEGAFIAETALDSNFGGADGNANEILFDPQQGVAPLSGQGGNLGGIPGMGVASLGSQSKKTLLERFRALPKRTQLIGVVAALLFGNWLMEEDKPPIKKKVGETITKKSTSTPSPVPSGVTGGYEQLSAEQKAFIESEHTLAFDFYRNKDYDKALFEIGKILAIVVDYKDTKELEKYAKEGKRKVEALEEEKKKKDDEIALREKIGHLVEQIRAFMDKKDYQKARPLFTDVLALDPDNSAVAEWRKEIQAEEEKIRIEEQKKEAQLELNKQGWATYREGMAIRKQRKYLSAIAVFAKIPDMGATDPKLSKLAHSMIIRCKADLKAAVKPALDMAKDLEGKGDLAGAFAWFKKVTQINPNETAGYAGMNRVRGVLHDRAKIMYTEAILAESYSDFANAKKLFGEIIKVAPSDDIYHDRAVRKLAHYFQEDEAPQ